MLTSPGYRLRYWAAQWRLAERLTMARTKHEVVPPLSAVPASQELTVPGSES
jgi:hypothetical protein